MNRSTVEPRVSPDVPELPLGLRKQEPTAAAEWLVALLKGLKQWTPAAEILRIAGLAVTEDNKRWLRNVRSIAGDVIIAGPGSPGYRHQDTLTNAEYHHWRGQMISQKDEMERAVLRADKHFYTYRPIN